MTAANCGWTFYLFTAKRKKEKTCWKCCIALDDILYCSGSLHSLTTPQLCAHVHNDRLYGSDDSGPGKARNTHGNGRKVKSRTKRLRMWRMTYFKILYYIQKAYIQAYMQLMQAYMLAYTRFISSVFMTKVIYMQEIVIFSLYLP